MELKSGWVACRRISYRCCQRDIIYLTVPPEAVGKEMVIRWTSSFGDSIYMKFHRLCRLAHFPVLHFGDSSRLTTRRRRKGRDAWMNLGGPGCRLQTCSRLATEWFDSAFRVFSL
ncbi:unnamed protein product [Brugia pahangi]|uniref:Uncharacterized protein n=1 Tax=Brugia pahangi TaxID=6280 RepID=A0A0N4TM64_BRUPA|nr:unnamed protein product [Brugia pahangi]